MRGQHEPVAEPVSPRELRRPARPGSPADAPTTAAGGRALGERGQVQLHVRSPSAASSVHDARARPAQGLGQRVRVVVRRRAPGERPPRLGQDDPRAVGEQLGRRRQVIEEERRRGLHPLGCRPSRDPRERSAKRSSPTVRGRGARPLAHRVVEDQLAHRPDVHGADRVVESCVRRRELADRVDLVAPVLQPDRPARVGREHVEHAAANRELPPVLDDVGPQVAEVDEPLGELVGREVRAAPELEGRRRPSVGAIALHRREDRRHEDERARRGPQRG